VLLSLMGTFGSSPRYSTSTNRPSGFNASRTCASVAPGFGSSWYTSTIRTRSTALRGRLVLDSVARIVSTLFNDFAATFSRIRARISGCRRAVALGALRKYVERTGL